MTHLYHRLTRQTVSTKIDIASAIDEQITDTAALALIANDGVDAFPVDEVLKDWSSFGTGFRMEPVVADQSHPVFLARRRIFHLLSDPDLALIERALSPHRRFHRDTVIEDAACRLSEMLEWQVLRPVEDGGLSLIRAASSGTSIVGWARKFLEGPNGAGKIASRVAGSRPGAIDDLESAAAAGYPAGAPLVHFDVEAVSCPSRGNEVSRILLARAKALRSAPAGSPQRLIAESAVAAESFGLPQLDASGLCAEVAEVLQEVIARRPEVAMEALNACARARRGDVVCQSPEVPSALIDLWAVFNDDHILTLRSLERSELWAKLLLQGALASRTVSQDRGRRRV